MDGNPRRRHATVPSDSPGGTDLETADKTLSPRFLSIAGEKRQTLRVPNLPFSLSTVSVLRAGGQDESKRSNSLLECGIIQGNTFQKLWLRLSIHKSKQRRTMQPPFTYLTAYTQRF